jgi:hypothetical protein
MSDLTLSFKINANTAAAMQQIAALRQVLLGIGATPLPDPTKNVRAGIDATSTSLVGLTAKLAGAAAAATAFGAAMKKGFDTNAESENVALGLKGIIASLQDVRDASGKPAEGMERLNIAGVEAERQLKLLRVAGMQTSAEFKDLAKAFQTALGAGSTAGLGVDQIRELTVTLTLAASAFNLAGDQLSSEIRAMLSGDQVDNSQIAQGLGISGAQIKLWREQGKLVEELNKRLKLFKMLGDEAGKSWSATLSNVADGISLFLGKTTKGAFDEVKKALQDALGGVFDEKTGEIKAQFQGLADFASQVFSGVGSLLADGVNGAVEGAKEFSAWLEKNNQTIGEIFDALSRIGRVFAGLIGGASDFAGKMTEAGDGTKFVRDLLNGVALVVAAIGDLTKGLAGAFAYVGSTVASILLDPLIGVSRVLSRITGKDYSAGLEKIKAETEKFKAAAFKFGADGFKFDGVKKVAAELQAAYAASPIKALDTKNKTTAPGGTIKTPARKPSEDAKKAAEAYRDALRAYEDAKADADKKIAQVARNASLRDLETSLKERLISQEEYLKKKAALDQKEVDQELQAARNKEAAIQKQINGTADKAKKKKLEGDLEKVKADIQELEDKGAAIPVMLKLQLAEFKEQVESLRIDIKANILDAQGQPFDAAVSRLKKETQDLLNDPRVRGNADMESLVRQQSADKQARLELEQAKRRIDEEASYFSLAQQRIAREVEQGKKTEIEAEKELQAEREKTRAGLEEYIATLEKLAKAYPNNKEFVLALAQARDQLEQLNTTVDKTATSINRAFADSVVDGLRQMRTEAVSVTDFLRNLFFKLFDDIANRALTALGDELFKGLQGMKGGGIGGLFSSLFSGGGGGFGSMFSSFFSGMGSMFGFAGGGHVQGPGTGTSDSIPAWLSNGEFVLKASAVRRWGLGFLNTLNAGVMPMAPRFADGGLVSVLGQGGGGTPNVTMQNNNMARLYLDPAHVASEIGRQPQFGRDVINVILANKGKLGLSRI